ncbi:Uncharacterised protein [Mycobacteroides abscessus subsp. abscessus]|nr:Uncharacterised protein [Mycobacteroides abscessus subsp. abscessus]
MCRPREPEVFTADAMPSSSNNPLVSFAACTRSG